MGELQLRDIRSICLFGGGDRLADACHSIRDTGLSLTVVSSPRHLDAPLGSGGTLLNMLKRDCVHLMNCRTMDDIRTHVAIDKYTLGISIGSPWIFSQDIIERFHGRLLNLHSTRLPMFKGGASYSWMLLMGTRHGASTLHQITRGVDDGDIVLMKEYEYPLACRTPQDFYDYSREHDNALIMELLDRVRLGQPLKTLPQSPDASTYYPRLSTDHHGFIDWNWEGADIDRFIAAFDDPYPGASTFLGSCRVHLKGCQCETETAFHPFQAGLVYRIQKGRIMVAARRQGISISKVLNEEATDITATIRTGMRFFTPQDMLDKAMSFSAIYTPLGLKATEK